MNISFKRGRWRVRNDREKLYKFNSEEEAKVFVESLEMPSVPSLQEVREYDSMEEAVAEEDVE